MKKFKLWPTKREMDRLRKRINELPKTAISILDLIKERIK